MQIETGLITWGGSGLLAVAVAVGVVKGKMSEYMTFKTHRDICEKERIETDKNLKEIRENMISMHGKINEIHGYLKAMHGGTL